MDWRKYFLWVPHWVPFIGMSSTAKVEREIGSFSDMKERLQQHIDQANAETARAVRKQINLEQKIANHEQKKKHSAKAIKRSMTIIKNINVFIGDDETDEAA